MLLFIYKSLADICDGSGEYILSNTWGANQMKCLPQDTNGPNKDNQQKIGHYGN